MARGTRCTECEDGWVHYATTIQEADPANGVHKVIKPSLFITRDRKYKVANICDNGAGVCHSCAHRVEKTHTTPAGFDDFVLNENKVKIIVQNLDTKEIIIDTVQVDYQYFFKAEPICDMDMAKDILMGGLCEVDFPASTDEKIARFEQVVKESGLTSTEYLKTLANE